MNGNERPLILFATYAAQPGLTADDRLFAEALERGGLAVEAAAWDDPAVAWQRAAAVVIRSTWNYHFHRAEFLAWTERAAAVTRLHNEPRVVRWNSHKRYLAELARRGVRVIETVFAEPGARLELDAIADAIASDDLVVKPAVSASAHETRRFAPHERAEAQAHVERLLAARDIMVQPHIAALAERGELSLLYAGGQFSHAIRRRSALVDAGQMPKAASTSATDAARTFATRVLAGASAIIGAEPNDLLYARVDLAETAPDEYLLLELELIEPSLFLVHAPEAAEHFASALLTTLSSPERTVAK
jgi:hypothetical protein